MKTSIVITTYKRAWAIRHCLDSIRNQTQKVDEVLILLKPSGDGSEKIISEYIDLPIRLMIQETGNVAYAVDLALKNAIGDYILFIDDDAIAHKEWVKRHVEQLENPIVAGTYGLTYKTYLNRNGDGIELTDQTYFTPPQSRGPHKRPLDMFSDYCTWVSTAGLPGAGYCDKSIYKSALFMGVNMGWQKEAVENTPLKELYKHSRKCLMYEQLLVCFARSQGYQTRSVNDPEIAPIVWHIMNEKSLSRDDTFVGEYWSQFDYSMMFWRLKVLGVKVSFPAYLFGLLITSRRKALPRLFGSIAGLFYGASLFISKPKEFRIRATVIKKQSRTPSSIAIQEEVKARQKAETPQVKEMNQA